MIRVVEINLVRRVLDSVFLLDTGAAAQRYIPSTQNRVPANIMVLFDNDYGGPLFPRHDGGRQARSSGAHDDDIRSMVPSNSALRCCTGFGYARTSQSRHSNTKRGTVLDEFSAANVEVFRFLAHVLFSSLQIKT